MSYKKKNSPVLEKAKKRTLSIKSISPTFEVGKGVNIENYDLCIKDTEIAQNEYNEQLRLADEKANILEALEAELKKWNKRMLDGVASLYGDDSNEYEKAGGKRFSDRKRVHKKEKVA
ncbi:MAG: hypothetical protein ACOYOV_13855 [Bacteroidales bacterium]